MKDKFASFDFWQRKIAKLKAKSQVLPYIQPRVRGGMSNEKTRAEEC